MFLLAVDLSKTSKQRGTNIVQRLQRQSSFVLPRKKAAAAAAAVAAAGTTSGQLKLQRPIHRGTHPNLD